MLQPPPSIVAGIATDLEILDLQPLGIKSFTQARQMFFQDVLSQLILGVQMHPQAFLISKKFDPNRSEFFRMKGQGQG